MIRGKELVNQAIKNTAERRVTDAHSDGIASMNKIGIPMTANDIVAAITMSRTTALESKGGD
jgi:hypothetical protein